jgi:hypothetical protein
VSHGLREYRAAQLRTMRTRPSSLCVPYHYVTGPLPRVAEPADCEGEGAEGGNKDWTCGLSKKEVEAIAEHEHMLEIAAAGMARCLLKAPHGAAKIRDMIRDDIGEALSRNDKDRASEKLMVLRHFLDTHLLEARKEQL